MRMGRDSCTCSFTHVHGAVRTFAISRRRASRSCSVCVGVCVRECVCALARSATRSSAMRRRAASDAADSSAFMVGMKIAARGGARSLLATFAACAHACVCARPHTTLHGYSAPHASNSSAPPAHDYNFLVFRYEAPALAAALLSF